MRHEHFLDRDELSWSDLIVLARSNHELGKHWITRLRDEAKALADRRFADWRINEAIANAAQACLDTWSEPADAVQHLDELDALIIGDDEPEPRVAPVERLSPAVFGGYR